MSQPASLIALLSVVGGIAVAIAPATAAANCGPSASAGGGLSALPSGHGESAPRYDAAVEFRTGVAAIEAGEFLTARRAFDRVNIVVPRHPEALFLSGYTRMRLGDWKGAQKRLATAAKLKPEMIEAQQYLGVAYARLGKSEAAAAVMAQLGAQMQGCGSDCADAPKLRVAMALVESAIADAQPAPLAVPVQVAAND